MAVAHSSHARRHVQTVLHDQSRHRSHIHYFEELGKLIPPDGPPNFEGLADLWSRYDLRSARHVATTKKLPCEDRLAMDRDSWDRDVASFVLRALPPPPTRVLEIGCGEGQLARRVAAAGYRVTAIDPEAPEGPLFERVTIEEFADVEPFEAAVAALSLHHIGGVGAAVEKIAGLLVPRGTFVVVEFAAERLDKATAAWSLEHLPDEAEHSWLARRRDEWRSEGGKGPADFAAYLRRWARSEGFHTGGEMLQILRRHFDETDFAWSPYLYPELDGITQSREAALIDSGKIQAIGFRFVGSARS